MKNILILTTMFVALATVSFGQVVTGSLHDLTGAVTDANMPGSFSGEVCAACHIPHASIVGTGEFLWSGLESGETFNMYTSSTVTAGADLTATGASLKCLGCHDDATTIHTTSVISLLAGYTGVGAVGIDLRNDHPVGIILDDTQADYKVPTNAKTYTDGVDNYVECGSCHNPHDNTLGSFLITTNDLSALCLDCHIK